MCFSFEGVVNLVFSLLDIQDSHDRTVCVYRFSGV